MSCRVVDTSCRRGEAHTCWGGGHIPLKAPHPGNLRAKKKEGCIHDCRCLLSSMCMHVLFDYITFKRLSFTSWPSLSESGSEVTNHNVFCMAVWGMMRGARLMLFGAHLAAVWPRGDGARSRRSSSRKKAQKWRMPQRM